MKTSKGKTWYYAEGFQLAQCRKLCDYIFGAFYFRAEADEHEMRFNIFVYDKIKDKNGNILKLEDFVITSDFEDYWCKKKQWKLIILEFKQ